jgi:dipeptide/tripeptide permease
VCTAIAGYFADKVYGDKAMLTDTTSTIAIGTALTAGYKAIACCFAYKVYGDKAMPADASVM